MLLIAIATCSQQCRIKVEKMEHAVRCRLENETLNEREAHYLQNVQRS